MRNYPDHSYKRPTRESATRAILEEQHIYTEFSKEVLEAAEKIPDHVRPSDCKDRTDLREWLTFTIDGDQSKDFDDAVSLTKNEDGTVTLGVHIADVGYYVKQGSLLDLEAYDRGTSVYFADRVAPMLPPALSNGICSLNPGVDRLTLSCIMKVDGEGKVVEYELLRSVICSKERMTYNHCNLLLAGEADMELSFRYAHILPVLRDLAALDEKLKAKRRRRGALELETMEREIFCDEHGRPVDVVQKGAGRSEGIIESMMLLANETVARHLHQNHLPAVYRIHEAPSEAKLAALKQVITPLGYTLKGGDHGSFVKLLRKSKGTPHQSIVNLLVLRAMMKAAYDPENRGHFGLAAEYYCHFTSPIRRYPDLMVNRVLTAELTGTATETKLKRLENFCKSAAVQSSEREVAAMTAEREIEKLYLAEYMEDRVGECYTAAVSGVAGFGLFVALPNGVEGLVPVRALPDDFYLHDEARMALVGERTGQTYTFGMELQVVCVAADGGTGRVDFLLLDEDGEPILPREHTPSGLKREPSHPKGKRKSPKAHIRRGATKKPKRGRRR